MQYINIIEMELHDAMRQLKEIKEKCGTNNPDELEEIIKSISDEAQL